MKISLFLITLLGLSALFSPSSIPGAQASSCVGPLLHTVSGEPSPFAKPGLRIGLLVEFEDGTKAFAFSPFFSSGHEALNTAITNTYGAVHGPVKKFLWGGEFEIQNGKIARANTTSGYLAGTHTSAPVDNKVSNLIEYFSQGPDKDIVKGTEQIPFDPKAPHLDKSFNEVFKGENARHTFGNELTNISVCLYLRMIETEEGLFRYDSNLMHKKGFDLWAVTRKIEIIMANTGPERLGFTLDSRERLLRGLFDAAEGKSISESRLKSLRQDYEHFVTNYSKLFDGRNLSEIEILPPHKP